MVGKEKRGEEFAGLLAPQLVAAHLCFLRLATTAIATRSTTTRATITRSGNIKGLSNRPGGATGNQAVVEIIVMLSQPTDQKFILTMRPVSLSHQDSSVPLRILAWLITLDTPPKVITLESLIFIGEPE